MCLLPLFVLFFECMSDRTHELFNLFVFDIKQQQIYSIKQEHSTHINQETELIVIENINMKERTKYLMDGSVISIASPDLVRQ